MIRALVGVVVRSLVELALVLLVIGALLLCVAGVIGQRIVTTNPNLVERAGEPPAVADDEYDDEAEETTDWAELVV